MKEFEDREVRVVDKRECVKLTCDACGSAARYPSNDCWEYGGAGSARGAVTVWCAIDGDYDTEEVDLCYECASALIEQIKRGTLKPATR